ncbi:multicopper oxidase [Amanita thiersii Skay4041]|uniref:laccase n=1 Tax=Amanita thiersii Skay4041 TaxID=703135 RepID=A0A2A9NIT4_9AGAR|nr:multicopper oxidase [Amanita thiersii Skay4041]
MRLLLCLLSCAYTLVSSVHGATRHYTLTLANHIVSPDGFSRVAVVANRSVEGPILTAWKNDHLQVHVVNNLTDKSMAQGTSIHWHGLFMHKSASQDGAAWVTQCPIAPGDSFTYNFNVGEQTGTYWYHSHITTQYCDGLRGALIIYDPNDPLKHLYDVDNEKTVITLGDWFHDASPHAWRTFQLPNSTLTNGLGRAPSGTPNANSTSALSVIEVTRGLRYRFRLINLSCMTIFNFSIDAHTMTVVETDGTETVPLRTEMVPISPGQRLSLIIKADQRVGNYWIRTEPFWDGGAPASNETGVNVAILRYAGAKKEDPTTEKKNGREMLAEEKLAPLVPSTLSHGTPDMSINLNISLNAAGTMFTINGFEYLPPPLPVLLQILNGSVDAQSIMPNGSVIVLPKNKLIEVTIPGGSLFAPHPFHLHGFNFAVVRSVGSSAINTINPPLRDVVNTGRAGDNVTFRFRTDNPGPWFLHCHLDFHLEAGLAVVLAVDPEGQVSGPGAVRHDKAWDNLCPKWNALKEGKQFSMSDWE